MTHLESLTRQIVLLLHERGREVTAAEVSEWLVYITARLQTRTNQIVNAEQVSGETDMTAIIIHIKDNTVMGLMIGRDVQELINQCSASWTASVNSLAISLEAKNPPIESIVEFHTGYWLITY